MTYISVCHLSCAGVKLCEIALSKIEKLLIKNRETTTTLFDGKFTEKFKDLLLANMSIRENDSVLDVACGNGRLLSKIAKTTPSFHFMNVVKKGHIQIVSLQKNKHSERD